MNMLPGKIRTRAGFTAADGKPLNGSKITASTVTVDGDVFTFSGEVTGARKFSFSGTLDTLATMITVR